MSEENFKKMMMSDEANQIYVNYLKNSGGKPAVSPSKRNNNRRRLNSMTTNTFKFNEVQTLPSKI